MFPIALTCTRWMVECNTWGVSGRKVSAFLLQLQEESATKISSFSLQRMWDYGFTPGLATVAFVSKVWGGRWGKTSVIAEWRFWSRNVQQWTIYLIFGGRVTRRLYLIGLDHIATRLHPTGVAGFRIRWQ